MPRWAWLLLLCAVPASRAAKLPDGVVRYWSCDDDEQTHWRDSRWRTGGSPGTAFDPAEKVEGRASLRLTGEPGDGELYVFSLANPAEVDATRRYTLRFAARTRGVTGEAFVRLQGHQAEGGERTRPLPWIRLTDQRAEFVLPADSDWTRYEVPVFRFPGGTDRVFFYLVIKGPGKVWFDDLSLAEEGVAVPVGGFTALSDADYAGLRLDDAALPGNVLTNGDFAEGLKGWQKVESGSRIAAADGVLRLTGVELTGAYALQQVRIDPRRPYRLRLRARCTGLVGYFYVHLLPFNVHRQPTGWLGADHATEFCYVTGTTDGWVERSQVVSFRPEQDSVAIFLRVDDTIGDVEIDDVRFEPLPRDGGVR